MTTTTTTTAPGGSEEAAASAADLALVARLTEERDRALAKLAIALTALEAIDRHVVGACEGYFGDVDPCPECGEMRDLAQNALDRLRKVAD